MNKIQSASPIRIEAFDYFAEVDPGLGRLLAFGRLGGSNVLWTNPAGTDVGGWKNFGGEKLWLWPQDEWPALFGADWPPPFDGLPWQGRAGDNWAEWELSLEPVLPVAIVRKASLEADGLRIHSEVCGSIVPFRLWSITQIERPRRLEVLSPTRRISPDEGEIFRPHSSGWSMVRSPLHGGKWFFDGEGIDVWTPSGFLAIRNHMIPQPGPDDPLEAVQVYFDADEPRLRPPGLPPYAELEFVAAPGSNVLDLTFHLDDQAGGPV